MKARDGVVEGESSGGIRFAGFAESISNVRVAVDPGACQRTNSEETSAQGKNRERLVFGAGPWGASLARSEKRKVNLRGGLGF